MKDGWVGRLLRVAASLCVFSWNLAELEGAIDAGRGKEVRI